MKRLFLIALSLTLICALLVPVPFTVNGAATSEEIFTYKFSKPSGAGDITAHDITSENYESFSSDTYTHNWYFHASSITRKSPFERNFYVFCDTVGAHWQAIVLVVPKAGYYKLDFKHSAHTEGGKANIYLIPGTAENKQMLLDNQKHDNKLFSSIEPIGNVDFYGHVPQIHRIINTSFTDSYLEAGEHILIFKGVSKGYNKCYMRPVSLTLTKQYTGAADAEALALELSDNNGTVKLGADITAGDVVVPKGVTLDLNGHKLTCDTFICRGQDSALIDSSNAEGLLISAQKPIFSDILEYLPLYQASKSGYRVFKYKVVTEQITTGDYCRKFNISLDFDIKSAYDILKAGEAGVEIDLKLNWSKNTTPVVYTTKGAANNRVQQLGKTGSPISLTVNNMNQLNAQIVSVTPVIRVGAVHLETVASICPVTP